LPSFAPRIRVEVYLPVRYEESYQDTLAWIIKQFTELRGGCTVIENAAGYYLSQYNETIDDRVSMIYCDFPMSWTRRAERKDVLEYCTELRSYMLRHLFEELS